MSNLRTGNRQLDTILHGGLEENSLVLLIGLPGTGKTILAQSIMFANAKPDKPALYISTAAEPLAKIIRFAQKSSFFDAEAVGNHVTYKSVGDILSSEGLNAAMERILELVQEYEPSILVIDSFKAFQDFAGSPEELSRYQFKLASALAALAVTAFWVGEYSAPEITRSPEFVLADTIIELALEESGVKDKRYLRIAKQRGSSYAAGKHAFDISETGLEIFPRLTAPIDARYAVSRERQRTGINLVDEMTGGGFRRGSVTVLFGPSGVGKTIACLQTIFKGIEAGEKGLIATVGENSAQLVSIAAGFGWDMEKAADRGLLVLLPFASDSVYVDEFGRKLIGSIEANRVDRVVVDSMNDLEATTDTPQAFRDFSYALIQHLPAIGASTLLTYEISELFAVTSLPAYGVGHMAQNVVLMTYVRHKQETLKKMLVLKSGYAHENVARQYKITSQGLQAAEGLKAA